MTESTQSLNDFVVAEAYFRKNIDPEGDAILKELGLPTKEASYEETWVRYAIRKEEICEFREYVLKENCTLVMLYSGRDIVLRIPFDSFRQAVSQSGSFV